MKAIQNKNRSLQKDAQEPIRKAPGVKKGRKRKIPDDELTRRTVMGLVKRGNTLDEIADIMKVSRSWLSKNYAFEIKSGRAIADALVVENLYQQAIKDTPSSITAGMYITRARMGWKDKPDPKETERPQVVFDFGDLTYEERAQLINKVRMQIGGPQIIEGEVYDEVTDDE